MFIEFQEKMGMYWKQRNTPVEPKRQRKKDLCVECGKQGFAVKMEYLGNKHVTMSYTRYDISFFRCPRCGHKDKQFMRIEGKGTGGANSGKMFGSM